MNGSSPPGGWQDGGEAFKVQQTAYAKVKRHSLCGLAGGGGGGRGGGAKSSSLCLEHGG